MQRRSPPVDQYGNAAAAAAPAPQNYNNNYYDEQQQQSYHPNHATNHPPTSEPLYEDVHATVDGSRSPAESERSNFTSISQRGVNPRWNPHPPMPNQHMPVRRQVQQRQDMILDNPDFQLPGARGAKPKGGNQGMVPGSAYPGGQI